MLHFEQVQTHGSGKLCTLGELVFSPGVSVSSENAVKISNCIHEEATVDSFLIFFSLAGKSQC